MVTGVREIVTVGEALTDRRQKGAFSNTGDILYLHLGGRYTGKKELSGIPEICACCCI